MSHLCGRSSFRILSLLALAKTTTADQTFAAAYEGKIKVWCLFQLALRDLPAAIRSPAGSSSAVAEDQHLSGRFLKGAPARCRCPARAYHAFVPPWWVQRQPYFSKLLFSPFAHPNTCTRASCLHLQPLCLMSSTTSKKMCKKGKNELR